MKILYIAGRWDPRTQTEYSGNDFGAYQTLLKEPGVELTLTGPFDFSPNRIERGLAKLYRERTGKRLFKYPLAYPRQCARVIANCLEETKPDLVFSRYSAALAKLKLNAPLVYLCDSIVPFTRELAAEFSKPAYLLMEKWERSVIDQAQRVITYSQANADLIVSVYGAPAGKVVVFPIPAFVPARLRPDLSNNANDLNAPLRLLFVGKRAHLRGVDRAIETVRQLNAEGIGADLRIVGMNGTDEEHIHYMGVFDKESPGGEEGYFANFSWAQLLLHPARFHAAGIVISEAAAFGLPTITNAVGGLATTVLHGKTGLVLPAGSPAAAYADAIKALMQEPERYQELRANARRRFDAELDWEKAGERLVGIVREAAGEEK